MIAMQYSIVLPADYDMRIIKDRIATKGALLDNFPGLVFKAYLYACKGEAATHSSDNLYAPFYLWENNEAMNRFLSSPGFAALCEAFGRPEIKVWSVWGQQLSDRFSDARYATREIVPIHPHMSLHATQESESAMGHAAINQGASVVISAYEPTTWTLLRFRLWRDVPDISRSHIQGYEIGYIATGKSADASESS